MQCLTVIAAGGIMAFLIKEEYPPGLIPRSMFTYYLGKDYTTFKNNIHDILTCETREEAERFVPVDELCRVVEIPDDKIAKIYLQGDGYMLGLDYILS